MRSAQVRKLVRDEGRRDGVGAGVPQVRGASRPRAIFGVLATIVLLVAVWLVLSARQTPSGATQRVQVTIDFAQPRATNGSMLGFLHGMNETTPPSRWIVPLHPAFWRGDFESAPYQRATRFGAKYILVVSDLWGYPGVGWYGRRPPWEDPFAWYGFVRSLALANRGRALVWDIWNEPNLRYFWDGTASQYYLTFLVAEKAIRSVIGPSAMVSGPSVAGFSSEWLRGLLAYCRAQGCSVDVLSWHEAVPAAISAISQHIKQARVLAAQDRPATRIRPVHVNEYLAATDTLYPGELVGYLDELERGGANGATLACWPARGGESACVQHTLDGLLDPQTMRPRGVWWTAKAYADGVGSRVTSTSSSPAVAAIAASRAADKQTAEVLLGYLDTHQRLPGTIRTLVTLRALSALPFMRRAHTLHITLERLLPGHAPSTPQPLGPPQDVSVSQGSATITTPTIAPHQAILIHLSAGRR